MSKKFKKSCNKDHSHTDSEQQQLLLEGGGEQLIDDDGNDQQAIRDAIDRNNRMRAQMGRQVQFDDLQDESYSANCYYFCMMWIIDIVILAVIVVILEFFKRRGNKCGIEVILWIEIFFIILLTQSTFRLNLLWIMRVNPDARVWFFIITMIVWWFFLSVWTIYGYIIYSSDDNDCQSHSDTTAWLVIMIICLFWGQLMMILFVCAVTCGPFLYCWIRDQFESPRGPLDGGQINSVISGLSKVGYSSDQFSDTRCNICFEDYQPDDELTQLKCNHYFHHACLSTWIKEGQNKCPLCRMEIEDVENLRGMLEGGEYDCIMSQEDDKSSERQSRVRQLIRNRFGSQSKSSSSKDERCLNVGFIRDRRKQVPKSSDFSGSSKKS